MEDTTSMVGQPFNSCVRARVANPKTFQVHTEPSLQMRLLVLALVTFIAGCASVTNPVANGVPVHMLPDELLAESKENLQPIPPTWLKAPTRKTYALDTGDILGVYIKDVLPISNQILPVNFPDSSSLPPSTGVPIPVREDGTVSLPLIGSVEVRGLSVEDAEKKIVNAYIDETQMLNRESENQILVSLARPRQIRVLVIRDDSPGTRAQYEDPGFRLYGSTQLGTRRGQGFGSVLEMPANEADVISALTRTGGLPGPYGTNEVFIYRGYSGFGEYDLPTDWNATRPGTTARPDGPQTIRIPMRIDANTKQSPIAPEDMRLYADDIVIVPARTTDVYYTGGLLPAREVPIPRDYDLPALEAVLRVGGSVINGGRFTNNFTGNITTPGLGDPNPSLLTVIRRMPGGAQVNIRVDLNKALTDPNENLLIKEGDVLLLQETPSEAVARYVSGVFRLNTITEIFRTGSAAATASVAVP